MSTGKHTEKRKHTGRGPIYLDCNATTPIEPEVEVEVLRFMREDFGNADSRTHEHGVRAKQAVQKARDQVAAAVKAQRDEVIFTSGATESNNLAILGLRKHGERTGRKHIISTAIEHKAVLEPLEHLRELGFEISLVTPGEDGRVRAEAVAAELRPETLLVSVMHVNNETGVIQPLEEIARALGSHEALFHVDAAQGFGKLVPDLQDPRIDLISVSGHKIYAPNGIGALVARRRGYERPPLEPLFFGGGQERGLRPGTLPVPLIAGLGKAAELAMKQEAARRKRCLEARTRALDTLMKAGGIPIGDQEHVAANTLSISFPGLDSEAVMLALKEIVAISNGSACTSASYTPSHVLTAMGLPEEQIKGTVRLSWCHLTPEVDWEGVAAAIRRLL